MFPTKSQNEPFVCPMFHYKVSLTIPSALIIMSPYEPFASPLSPNNRSSRYHRQLSLLNQMSALR